MNIHAAESEIRKKSFFKHAQTCSYHFRDQYHARYCEKSKEDSKQ